MTLDPLPAIEMHRRLRRDFDHEDARDRALEGMAEEIAGRVDELAALRREYDRLKAWEPEPVQARGDRDLPGYDRRSFGRDEADNPTRHVDPTPPKDAA